MWEERTCWKDRLCPEYVVPGSVGFSIPPSFFYFFFPKIKHVSVKELIDRSWHKVHDGARALTICADFKPHFYVFIGTAFSWNVPICFSLCASTSDRVKIWMDLSDSEAVAWSYIVGIIQCHVHMLILISPHFRLNCNRLKKKKRKHLVVLEQSMKYKPDFVSVSHMWN